MTVQERSRGKFGSTAYALTLTIGCVGLPFLGMGLGGELIVLSGGDPMHAVDVEGMALFILMFAILFSVRLIFWPSTPPKLRALVRVGTTVILTMSFVASVIGAILLVMIPGLSANGGLPILFSLLALSCQPCTLLWLLRYRTESP